MPTKRASAIITAVSMRNGAKAGVGAKTITPKPVTEVNADMTKAWPLGDGAEIRTGGAVVAVRWVVGIIAVVLSRHHHRTRSLGLLLLVALLISACGSSSDTASSDSPATIQEQERPFEFSVSQFTVVDPTRVTPATETTDELPERTIDFLLYLPDSDRPVPLVVFSHGMNGHPEKFEALHQAWAPAGYAVAAPTFPLTNDRVDNPLPNLADGLNQPADVVLVLDHLLDESSDADSDLAGRFDPDRLAAAGLSLGGATTYEVAVNDVARDDRFRAAMVMSGFRFTNEDDGGFVASDGIPVYVLHGDADPLIPVSVAKDVYEDLAAPRFFLTLEGGGHAGPFEDEGGFEPKIPGMDAVVFDSTIAFWDRYLLGATDTADDIIDATSADGIGVLVYDE
jgi:dienelactone hydrolase